MDRLVCGDVGFGKTEVALRAAFIAVLGGKQVAILSPTTLLAEQHFQHLYRAVSADWPVKYRGDCRASRAPPRKWPARDRRRLERGHRSISSIGTHKLLSSDVIFKRLGLC